MRLPAGLAGPQPSAWQALLLSMMAPASASRPPRPSRASTNGWCRAEFEVLDPRSRGGLVPSPRRVSRAAGHRPAQSDDLAGQLTALLSRRQPQRSQGPAAVATDASRRPEPAVMPGARLAAAASSTQPPAPEVDAPALALDSHANTGAGAGVGVQPPGAVTPAPPTAPSPGDDGPRRTSMDTTHPAQRRQLEQLAQEMALLGWIVRLEPHTPVPGPQACLAVRHAPDSEAYLLVQVGRHLIQVWTGAGPAHRQLGTAADVDDVQDLLRGVAAGYAQRPVAAGPVDHDEHRRDPQQLVLAWARSA